MNNKIVWLIGGIVITYFFIKNKCKKEMITKIDNAVATTAKELNDDFNKAMDIAISKGYDVPALKQLINAPK